MHPLSTLLASISTPIYVASRSCLPSNEVPQNLQKLIVVDSLQHQNAPLLPPLHTGCSPSTHAGLVDLLSTLALPRKAEGISEGLLTQSTVHDLTSLAREPNFDFESL